MLKSLLAVLCVLGLLAGIGGYAAPVAAATVCPDGYLEEMAGRSCADHLAAGTGSSGGGGGHTSAPSASGGLDPQSAAAIGNILGQLLVMAINSANEHRGEGGAAPAPSAPVAPPCTGGWCFPSGNPASFKPGSRQQIAAVCAMQSQDGGARYLSGYSSVDDCTDRLTSVAGYSTKAAFGPAVFNGSDLPPPPMVASRPSGSMSRCHCSQSKRPGCSALITFTSGADHVDVQTNTPQCTLVFYQIDGRPVSTTVTDGYEQEPIVFFNGERDVELTRTYPDECFICADDNYP